MSDLTRILAVPCALLLLCGSVAAQPEPSDAGAEAETGSGAVEPESEPEPGPALEPVPDSDPDRDPEPAAELAPEHRLRWNEGQWRRFDWIEYAATAAILGIYAGIEFGIPPPNEANWTGPILFDEGFRDWSVGGTRGVRTDNGSVSDFMTWIPQGWVFFDTIAIPLFTDDWNWDVAWQMTAMNIQAVGLVGLLSRFGHRVIARERPDVAECREDGDYGPHCFGGSNASFPSGHTSAAFVAAGLMCAHHQHVPLYGGGTPDLAACLVTLTMASGSAGMRLVADRHWFSDVFVGALLGFGIGYGLPLLLHYTGEDTHPRASEPEPILVRWSVAPMSSESALGAQIFGTW